MKILKTGIYIILFLIVTITFINRENLINLYGFELNYANLESNSMYPTIGNIDVTVSIKPNNIKTGDIIVYEKKSLGKLLQENLYKNYQYNDKNYKIYKATYENGTQYNVYIYENNSLYWSDGFINKRIIHRIIDTFEIDGKNHYLMLGDNNKYTDPVLVEDADIYAKYSFRIKKLGLLIHFIKTKYGLAVFFINYLNILIIIELLTDTKSYKYRRENWK